jgi:hypothetical protein
VTHSRRPDRLDRDCLPIGEERGGEGDMSRHKRGRGEGAARVLTPHPPTNSPPSYGPRIARFHSTSLRPRLLAPKLAWAPSRQSSSSNSSLSQFSQELAHSPSNIGPRDSGADAVPSGNGKVTHIDRLRERWDGGCRSTPIVGCQGIFVDVSRGQLCTSSSPTPSSGVTPEPASTSWSISILLACFPFWSRSLCWQYLDDDRWTSEAHG